MHEKPTELNAKYTSPISKTCETVTHRFLHIDRHGKEILKDERRMEMDDVCMYMIVAYRRDWFTRRQHSIYDLIILDY